MNDAKKDILILGVGNDILTDDGIGPKITMRLKNESNISGNIHYDTAFMGGLDLLEFIRDYKTVIIIDAIKTKDGKPGDVFYCTPDDFKYALHLDNLHDVSFLTAIKLGKKSGYNITDNIHIIAVEVVEDRVFSNDFSPEIQKKYEDITATVKRYINEILSESS